MFVVIPTVIFFFSSQFAQDARDVMDTLLKNHENGDIIAEDDPYHTYLISAWARICIVLGWYFFGSV